MTRFTALAALTVLSTSIVACVASPEDEVAEVQAALELDDGGLDMSTELRAFGDLAVDETPELSGADVNDTTAIEAQAEGMDRYRVLLLWGALPRGNDDDAAAVPTEVLDWSGSVSVSAGAVRVSRTLKFDGHDGLEPREDPRVVSFRSHTLPHVDGLALEIMAPPDATISFSTVTLDASVAPRSPATRWTTAATAAFSSVTGRTCARTSASFAVVC